MSLIEYIWETSNAPAHVKIAAFKRVHEDPAVPSARSTDPFWLADKHPQFDGEPTVPLPKEAFCVIIGSGITGASAARNIVRTRLGPEGKNLSSEARNGNVVMLDAREIVGGATGRNGGHVNEVAYSDYPYFKTAFGKEAGQKIMRFRMNHVAETVKMAEEEGLTDIGQVRKVTTESVAFDKAAWNEMLEHLELFKQDFGPEADGWKAVHKEDLKKHGTETADGIILSPAGAAWPYRLLTALLAKLTKDDTNFSVYPFTPVTKIERSNDTNYLVITPRGIIKTKHILHATNSHVSHHIPGLRARVMPLRGQMSAQSPPSTFEFRGDNTSWSFGYQMGFDYLTQLPKNTPSKKKDLVEGQEMMFGGGLVQARHNGFEELGVVDDSVLNPTIAQHLSTMLTKAFTCVKGETFLVKSMWTGIMAFSTDGLPWVGRVPESATGRKAPSSETSDPVPSGEWVAAGYSGEGMVQAWGCGKAVSMMILGLEEQTRSWFPEQFIVTEKRLADHPFDKHVKVPEGAAKL
ncbi:hypothetical protein KEM56_005613 [Ascosphaera pollenicola]|nr:hypothetical protein KEM56_005613 [Ascosphaera pollenicola]